MMLVLHCAVEYNKQIVAGMHVSEHSNSISIACTGTMTLHCNMQRIGNQLQEASKPLHEPFAMTADVVISKALHRRGFKMAF